MQFMVPVRLEPMANCQSSSLYTGEDKSVPVSLASGAASGGLLQYR